MERFDLIDALVNVGVHLLAYCATDCANPWACDGCAVQRAKRALERLEMSAYRPELTVTLEEDEVDAERYEVTAVRGHLVVMDGGKK